MSRGIETAFWGTLGRDPDLRTSKAGNPFCLLAVAVTTGKDDAGKDTSTWLRVTCFGETAKAIGGNCSKGDRVYVEGTLTPNEYEKDGEKRHGLNVAAWKCERVGNIGQHRLKRETADERQR